MKKIVAIKALANYHIWLRFNDGHEAIVDLSPFLGKGISKDILNIDYFNQITIDDFGGICWDNGFDFCPVFLRQLANSEVKKAC